VRPVWRVWCFAVAGSLLAAQAASAGSVEGQVVSSVDGTPVRRAAVFLTGGPIHPVPGRPRNTPAQAETDDQGGFVFEPLEAGRYILNLRRDGYVVNDDPRGGLNLSVELGDGQQLSGLKLRMTPQSVIAGKVTDENGDPVVGAEVIVQRAGTANGITVPIMNAAEEKTNDLGEYRIPNLGAGDYIVGARIENRGRDSTVSYMGGYHPSASAAKDAARIHVAAAAVASGADIHVKKISGFTVRGKVMDGDGPGNLTGVTPRLVSSDQWAYVGVVRPKPDGSFEFTGVPAGTYTLYASRPVTAGSTAPLEATASTTVEVGGDVGGALLQMKPTVELQGTITADNSCYVPGSTVTLAPTRSGFPVGVPTATVSSDSRFTLKNVSTGAQYFLFSNGGSCYVKSLRYRGQAASPDGLVIDAAGALEVTLAAFTSVLNVAVVDQNGKPLQRARFTVTAMDDSPEASGITLDNGQGRITFLRSGTYRVYAFEMVQQILAPNADYLKAFESRAKTVTLGATGTATVQVTAIPAPETGGTRPSGY